MPYHYPIATNSLSTIDWLMISRGMQITAYVPATVERASCEGRLFLPLTYTHYGEANTPPLISDLVMSASAGTPLRRPASLLELAKRAVAVAEGGSVKAWSDELAGDLAKFDD